MIPLPGQDSISLGRSPGNSLVLGPFFIWAATNFVIGSLMSFMAPIPIRIAHLDVGDLVRIGPRLIGLFQRSRRHWQHDMASCLVTTTASG